MNGPLLQGVVEASSFCVPFQGLEGLIICNNNRAGCKMDDHTCVLCSFSLCLPIGDSLSVRVYNMYVYNIAINYVFVPVCVLHEAKRTML